MKAIRRSPTPTGRALARAVLQSSLDWCATQRPEHQRVLLPGQSAAWLSRSLDDATLWAPGTFQVLFDFVQMLAGLAAAGGAVAPCTIGDLLTALGLDDTAPTFAWPWAPEVDGAVVRKLEVRETSAGITKNQRENREAWWAHAERNRRFVRQAIRLCSGSHPAVPARRTARRLGMGSVARQGEQPRAQVRRRRADLPAALNTAAGTARASPRQRFFVRRGLRASRSSGSGFEKKRGRPMAGLAT